MSYACFYVAFSFRTFSVAVGVCYGMWDFLIIYFITCAKIAKTTKCHVILWYQLFKNHKVYNCIKKFKKGSIHTCSWVIKHFFCHWLMALCNYNYDTNFILCSFLIVNLLIVPKNKCEALNPKSQERWEKNLCWTFLPFFLLVSLQPMFLMAFCLCECMWTCMWMTLTCENTIFRGFAPVISF